MPVGRCAVNGDRRCGSAIFAVPLSPAMDKTGPQGPRGVGAAVPTECAGVCAGTDWAAFYSRILPSVLMVTTCQGINLPLA